MLLTTQATTYYLLPTTTTTTTPLLALPGVAEVVKWSGIGYESTTIESMVAIYATL